MKKRFIILSLLVGASCFAEVSFAFFGSPPKIHEKHIEKDLIGRRVQHWTFQDASACRIDILDAKYDKNAAIVYVSVQSTEVTGKYGLEGKLRLEYEYAADDWNLLNIKAITFSKYSVARKIADSVIPELLKRNEGFKGRPLDITMSLGNEIEAQQAAIIFIQSGALVNTSGNMLKIKGDLGQTVDTILRHARRMFLGDTQGVVSRYGYPREDIVRIWSSALTKMAEFLKDHHKIEEFEFVSDVVTNVIQSACNFYGKE